MNIPDPMRGNLDDADTDFLDEEDFEDADDDLFDCHLMDDGQCMAAGSEYCDFECPMRDSEFFAGSAAWNKKHGVKSP